MKVKAFSFSAEGKAFDACISRISQALTEGAGDATYIVNATGGRLYLIGVATDAFVRVEVPNSNTDKKAEGAFALDSDGIKKFQGLIKGRAILDFNFNGSECEYKLVKARYSGKIFTLPISEDLSALVENFLKSKGSSVALSSDAVSLLQQGTSVSAIKDVFDNKPILSYVSLNKKGGLTISAFDDLHFSLYKVDTGVSGCEFEVALPAKYFALIDKIADSSDAKFQFNSGSVRVSGKTFLLVLPAVQAESKHFSMAEKFIEGQGKPASSLSYSHSELQSVLANLYNLFAVNSTFDISAKSGGKTINIGISTDSGSAADAVKVESKKSLESMSVSVEPRLFNDIASLASNIEAPTFEFFSRVIGFKGRIGDASLQLYCAKSGSKGK